MEHFSLFFLLAKVGFFFKAAFLDWQNLLVVGVAFIALQIEGLGHLPKELIPIATILFIGIGIWNRYHESQKTKHESDLQREIARAEKLKNDRVEHELEQLKLKSKITKNDEEE